jgi:hypothetical protein
METDKNSSQNQSIESFFNSSPESFDQDTKRFLSETKNFSNFYLK